MLCRIFHSQGVQPARTLQLSYHTAQGSGTDTGFTAAGCVHVCTLTLAFRWWWWWWGRRSNLSVCTCRCSRCVSAYLCLYLQFFPACVCWRTPPWRSSRADLFRDWNEVLQTVWLPTCGAPQSRLMMCERRGEQIRTAIPQHADAS